MKKLIAVVLFLMCVPFFFSIGKKGSSSNPKEEKLPYSQFEANKAQVMAEIQNLVDKHEFIKAKDVTWRYQEPAKFREIRNEINLAKVNYELAELLAHPKSKDNNQEYIKYCEKVAQLYEKAYDLSKDEIALKNVEKWLYEKARVLPSSDVEANYYSYSKLCRLFPNNTLYASKKKHYKKKVDVLRRKEQQQALRDNNDLELKTWHWSREYDDYVVAEGQVENLSGRKLGYIKVLITYYDGNGQMITSDFSYLDYNPLMPGQISPFKVMTRYNPMMKKAGIDFLQGSSRIAWYQK